MEFKGDYHTHTLYSDGRASLEEMIIAAKAQGLQELGIADHGPRNIGTGVKNESIFLEIKEGLNKLQVNFPSLQLKVGAEADVLNLTGELDISKKVIKELDYLLAGLHPYIIPQGLQGVEWILENQIMKVFPTLKERVKTNNTKALVEAIHNYDLWAITHPGLKMDVDAYEVARACISCDTLWEINAGHKFPSYEKVREVAGYGVDFIVNSDAHFPESVGCLEYGSWVLEKVGVPPEKIKNAKVD